MQHDDEFEPKLGKIRSRSLPQSTFLRQVQKTLGRTSGLSRRISGRKSRFDGSRIGRGSGAGRFLASRDHYSALRSRRVVIKARLIRLAGSGLNGAKAHLRYLQRDGVTRDGAPGDLTLAAVRFDLDLAAHPTLSYIAPVAANGAASITITAPAGGTYQVTTQVIGGYFASPRTAGPAITINAVPTAIELSSLHAQGLQPSRLLQVVAAAVILFGGGWLWRRRRWSPGHYPR